MACVCDSRVTAAARPDVDVNAAAFHPDSKKEFNNIVTETLSLIHI